MLLMKLEVTSLLLVLNSSLFFFYSLCLDLPVGPTCWTGATVLEREKRLSEFQISREELAYFTGRRRILLSTTGEWLGSLFIFNMMEGFSY